MRTKIILLDETDEINLLERLERIEKVLLELSNKITLPENSNTEYITRKEVAKLFKISLVTVHDWTSKGILTAYKIANRVYYKRPEVEAAAIKVWNKKELFNR